MRIMLIVAWLFTGLGGLIYHFGPGQEHLEVDRINGLLKEARNSVEEESWSEAVTLFDEVLSEMPSEKKAETQAVTLEKARRR